MTKEDWITVGLKLLGVYFGILALVSIFLVLVVAILAAGSGKPTSYDFSAFLDTLGYLIVAVVLIRRTNWCLKLVCPESRDAPTKTSLDENGED